MRFLCRTASKAIFINVLLEHRFCFLFVVALHVRCGHKGPTERGSATGV